MYLYIIQELQKRFRGHFLAFLENLLNFFANVHIEVGIKIRGCTVFVLLKIQLNWEVGRVFSCECVKCESEKGRFTGLTGREKDDIFTLFNTLDKIGCLFCTPDNVVIFKIQATFGSKTSHFLFSNGIFKVGRLIVDPYSSLF